MFIETSVLSVLGIYPDRLKGELVDDNLLWPFPNNCHPKRTEWSQFRGSMSVQGRGAYRAESTLPFRKCAARRQESHTRDWRKTNLKGLRLQGSRFGTETLCAACMHVCTCWDVFFIKLKRVYKAWHVWFEGHPAWSMLRDRKPFSRAAKWSCYLTTLTVWLWNQPAPCVLKGQAPHDPPMLFQWTQTTFNDEHCPQQHWGGRTGPYLRT